jgi:hypothetical protein
MFKRIMISAAFVGALAVGGLAMTSTAQARHCDHGPGYGYGYGYPGPSYAYAYRSAYYRPVVYPAPRRALYHGHGRYGHGGHGAYYGVPGYGRGPGFRLSVGF